jgi:hypothetical protein
MLTKNDFSATDWGTLRDTPHLVGFATLMAGSSGLGTIKESIALAQSVLENQTSAFAFIRDLSSRAEIEAAQGSLRTMFGGAQGKPNKETLQRLALEQVRNSLSLLTGKAGKEETDAWRKMLYGTAEKVAGAAREGGFLGFGGSLISEGEQSFLNQLRDTLQLEQARKA